MEEVEDAAPARGERLVARVERAYLAALRVALLLLATGLILYALWLAVAGLWGWSRDPASVKEAPVAVTAQEVAALPADAPPATDPGDPLAKDRGWYRGFTDRYYRLYAGRYERFRQAADAKLTRDQFERRFVGIDRRLAGIEAGALNAGEDRAALERLLATMTDVAALPETVRKLERYRTTVRSKVSRVAGHAAGALLQLLRLLHQRVHHLRRAAGARQPHRDGSALAGGRA